MRIAILGTGHMGQTLAAGFAAAGHNITFGSRAPETKSDLSAPVRGYAEAIGRSEVVVSALAAAHSLDILTPLKDALRGRVLIDIGNAVDERLNLIYADSSLGRRLQDALPDTAVVKTLNTVAGPIGVAPALLSAPTSVFLSGDAAAAKATVSELLADLGWAQEQQLDLGGIDTARAVEHYFLLFAALMGSMRTPAFNLAIIR